MEKLINLFLEEQIERECKSDPPKHKLQMFGICCLQSLSVVANEENELLSKCLGFACITVGLIYLISLPQKAMTGLKDYISIFIPLPQWVR